MCKKCHPHWGKLINHKGKHIDENLCKKCHPHWKKLLNHRGRHIVNSPVERKKQKNEVCFFEN